MCGIIATRMACGQIYFKKNKFRILVLKKIGNRQNELKKTDFADPLPPSVVNTRSETCGAWTPPNIPKFEFFKPYDPDIGN